MLSHSCWLQDDVFFYVTVVAFVLLILLCNIAVFTVVLIQIRQTRANKPSANRRSSVHDLRAVASLTVLLGLTWSMGFFSFGPGRVVLLYLFSICNTLQGKNNISTTYTLSRSLLLYTNAFGAVDLFSSVSAVLSCRFLCLFLPLSDERQREETVENPLVLWTFAAE